MKALVVRLSSIGDVVHTLPALAALSEQGWQVGWLVEAPARPLLLGQPMLADVVEAPAARRFALQPARDALRALRDGHYDVAIDFQGLWKSAAWTRLSGAQRLLGFAAPDRRESLSSLLVREHALMPPEAVHVIDKNLALLRALDIEAVGQRRFPLPPAPAAAESIERFLGATGFHDFAILNPGGGWTGKLWPPERYAGVARGLQQRGTPVLVTWGPGEEALADRIVAAAPDSATKCYATSLLEYVELARRARLVVAADTGPLHLACAVGTPVVGIFGPTDPARNGPFSSEDLVVRRTPLCAPCHKRRCDVHHGVMEAIAESEVLSAIDRRLAGAGARPLAV